jgi:predicted nucleotidyltransferase
MMVDEALLSSAVERIVERMNPERIILFGSQARGTADERSDVDLLVISQFTGKRREIVAELYWDLRDSGFAEDIILMTPEEYESERQIPGTIARPASREGKVIYECA